MTDSAQPNSLDDLIATITASVEQPATAKARFIVATDWSRGALPLTVLRSFRALVPAAAPVELVFAVPHEPSEIDAACVNVLVDELDMGGALSGLEVASFDRVLAEPYDCAIVPTSDHEQNLAELGGFILRMRDLMRIYETARGGGESGSRVARNPGSTEALKTRLDAFGS